MKSHKVSFKSLRKVLFLLNLTILPQKRSYNTMWLIECLIPTNRHKKVTHKTTGGMLAVFLFRNCFRRFAHNSEFTLSAFSCRSIFERYTVKLVRAKLPANAGNFTCSSQVKRSLAQFTCVTCSLPVNTGKFPCFEAASTSRKTHANCLRAHVNLPEYHRHFTGSFTCGTHANLMLLQAKIHATYRQKHRNRRQKYPPNAGKNNSKRRKKYPHNRRQKNLQCHAELPAIAGNLLSHRG